MSWLPRFSNIMTWFNEYSKFLKTERWKLIRERALNYYGRKCKCCGTGYGRLQVHHLTYDRFQNPPMSHLTILCEDCHREVTKITRTKKLKGVYAVAFHKKICVKRKRLK